MGQRQSRDRGHGERSGSVWQSWRFNDERGLASDCEVVFFEIAADEKLHVNVTHRRLTREIRGWAGPADTPDGFVHNRTFGATPAPQLVRNIARWCSPVGCDCAVVHT